jgi:hypothetical protein
MARFSVVGGEMGEHQWKSFQVWLYTHSFQYKSCPMMAGTTHLYNNFVNTLGVQPFMLTSCREIASAYFREQASRWRGLGHGNVHTTTKPSFILHQTTICPTINSEATAPHVSVTSMAHIRQDAAE